MTDKSITILAVVLVALVLGILLFRVYVEEPPVRERHVNELQSTEPKRQTSVIAKSTSCSRVGGRTQVHGYVENTGNVTLTMVIVQPLWKNAAGLVVDTGLVYVVSKDAPLLPGERREFEDVTQRSNISRCNVVPLDWGA